MLSSLGFLGLPTLLGPSCSWRIGCLFGWRLGPPDTQLLGVSGTPLDIVGTLTLRSKITKKRVPINTEFYMIVSFSCYRNLYQLQLSCLIDGVNTAVTPSDRIFFVILGLVILAFRYS